MPLNNGVIRANKKYEGQSCAICKREIFLGDLIHICPKCQSINHEECWNNEGGCNSLSCNSLNFANMQSTSTMQQTNMQRPSSTPYRPEFARSQMGGINSQSRPDMSGGFSSSSSQPNNMIPCRWCKEPIMRGARKCKHCGEYQRDEDRNNAKKFSDEDSSLSATDWIGVFCCPIIGLIQGGVYKSQGKEARGNKLIQYSVISLIFNAILNFLRNIH